MDFYPTILELAGLNQKPKQHLDGKSLVSAVSGKPAGDLDGRFLAWTYPHHHGSQHSPSNAIRLGDWKLIQKTDEKTKPEDQYELYNLADDIGESKDLAKSKPERTQKLAAQLKQWLDATSPK